jgi:hypothetical protein
VRGSFLDQRGDGLVRLVHRPREVVRALSSVRGRFGQTPVESFAAAGGELGVRGRAKQRVRELESFGPRPHDAGLERWRHSLDIRLRRRKIRHRGQLRQHVARLLREVPQPRLDEFLETCGQREVLDGRVAIYDRASELEREKRVTS